MAGEAGIIAAGSKSSDKIKVISRATGIRQNAETTIQQSLSRIKDNKKKAENGANLINPNKQ